MSSTPEIRQHVKDTLAKAGINIKTTNKRGYDHGVFIPFMSWYPENKIPVV